MDRETNGCLLICGPSSTTWHSQTKNRMGAFWENRFWNFGLKWPFVAYPLLSVAFRPAQFNLPRTFLARGIDCRKNWSSRDSEWCRKLPFYAIFCVFWHKKGKNKIKMMRWKAESFSVHFPQSNTSFRPTVAATAFCNPTVFSALTFSPYFSLPPFSLFPLTLPPVLEAFFV